jgi:hypothetical protein
MKRIGTKIEINPSIKKEVIDGVEYEYQEYQILDDENHILESNKFYITDEPATVEKICEETGIKLGVSIWITI